MRELQKSKDEGMHYQNNSKVREVEKKIDMLLQEEEIHWKQRSRISWLKEGDRNTMYFHVRACSRRKSNNRYFKGLFETINPTKEQITAAVQSINIKIPEEVKADLDKPFSRKEVIRAIWQSGLSKAPGPDGIPASFYQRHWGQVAEDTVKACLHILNQGGSVEDDSLIYMRASVGDYSNIKRTFDCSVAASGQVFNYDKSSIFFSPNVSRSIAQSTKDILQLKEVFVHEKYLGLPSMIGKSKKQFFNELRLKLSSKVKN